jgi:hypothetical protein
MDLTLSGRCGDLPCQVELRVHLVSDGPATVTAHDAQRLIVLGRKELLMPYQGEGRYQLRTKDETTTREDGN